MKTEMILSFVILAIGFTQVLSDQRVFTKEVENVRERIFGGTPAVANQFPYQAYLQIVSTSGQLDTCSGALISDQWVLTGAICLWNVFFVIVRLGNINISTPDIVLTCSVFHIHPDFDPYLLSGNVGLINLGRSVSITESVRPIRIPTDSSITYAGTPATVSGFGRTSNTGPYSDVLNYGNVTIIENSECQPYYDPYVIYDFIICAVGSSEEIQSPCIGDTAGPLVHYEPDGEPVLVGLVYFGASLMCDTGVPDGYIRPYFFLEWINSIINVDN